MKKPKMRGHTAQEAMAKKPIRNRPSEYVKSGVLLKNTEQDFAEVPPPTHVLLSLERTTAEELSNGLSDLGCWLRGYMAALGDNYDRHPMNADVVTRMNLFLKSAINRADDR